MCIRDSRRDALLENVVVRADGSVDFDDGSKTENTRVSYPIYHIDNIVKPVSRAGHATKVIFLTAAVSYTHLDVYKRQILSVADRKRGLWHCTSFYFRKFY